MKINIAYSCNEAYIQHTGISILSLLENNKLIPNITIYFIQKEVKEESIALLSTIIESYEREVKIISFDDLCFDLKVNTTPGRHIETIYTKLFLSRIEDIDKIIYLDSDTIINDSLKEFWEIDLGDNLFGGVNAKAINSAKALDLGISEPFINDGIVIINIEGIRKQNMITKFITYINEHNGNPPLLSEGVINKVCIGKIKVIHPKYNLMSGLIEFKGNRFANVNSYYTKKIIEEAILSPVIIHYLSAFYNRPWYINCTHPMKEYYLQYKSLSSWKEVPLENKKLSSRLQFIKLLYDVFPHNILDFIRYLKDIIKSKSKFKKPRSLTNI